MRIRVAILICVCLGVVFTVWAKKASTDLTFRELKELGIVSGFGREIGDPLKLLDRIPPIDEPRYTELREKLYPDQELCIGHKTDDGWRFSPIYILYSHEVVNDGRAGALCFCPLAGLSVALPDEMRVSGLLKYDTFVLYRESDRVLINPLSQETVIDGKPVGLRPIHLLTYAGVLEHFPDAQILNPSRYRKDRFTYGNYPNDRKMGIGHAKPGLKKHYSPREYGFHPKERVLLAGFNGKIAKAYPINALRNRIGSKPGQITDTIDGRQLKVHYNPELDWAYATDPEGKLLNLGYGYIFAVIQHLPGIPVYR